MGCDYKGIKAAEAEALRLAGLYDKQLRREMMQAQLAANPQLAAMIGYTDISDAHGICRFDFEKLKNDIDAVFKGFFGKNTRSAQELAGFIKGMDSKDRDISQA